MKNYHLFKLVCLIIMFSASSYSFGQTNPKEIISKFFTKYEENGASNALDYLYANNNWMKRAKDDVANVKQRLEGLNEAYVGKFHGYELIVEKKLSDSFILMSYLVKFDRQPIRFTFQFYKPNNEWRTQSFKFDGNIDDEIEESAKVYFLDLNKK